MIARKTPHSLGDDASILLIALALAVLLMVAGLAGFYAWDIYLAHIDGAPAAGHVALNFKKG